jgi:hypothetical protein
MCLPQPWKEKLQVIANINKIRPITYWQLLKCVHLLFIAIVTRGSQSFCDGSLYHELPDYFDID